MNEVSAVDLDRQAIAKSDFPTSRRGYEHAAVEAHLDALATEVERLQAELARTSAVAGAQPLSAAASEQVQLIVEAAEHSASEIVRAAEEESVRVCADADATARRVREESVERSRDHVGRVAEATEGMLERVEAMDSELGVLLETLRAGGRRLTADVSLLTEQLGELHGAPSATGAAPQGGSVVIAPDVAEPEPVVADRPPAAAHRERGGGDVEGARLIALNMALDGRTREEADEYLSANFELGDQEALLADVYATVDVERGGRSGA